MENKTNKISHLVNDVVTPGEIADASWASALDEELSAWDELFSDDDILAAAALSEFEEEYDDLDEEETYDEYDEYESLYSKGYGFISMHKHSQPTRNFKHKRGDK
jgi:hypothetical protein